MSKTLFNPIECKFEFVWLNPKLISTNNAVKENLLIGFEYLCRYVSFDLNFEAMLKILLTLTLKVDQYNIQPKYIPQNIPLVSCHDRLT